MDSEQVTLASRIHFGSGCAAPHLGKVLGILERSQNSVFGGSVRGGFYFIIETLLGLRVAPHLIKIKPHKTICNCVKSQQLTR